MHYKRVNATARFGDRSAKWVCDRCGFEVKGKTTSRKRRDGLKLCLSCVGDKVYITLAVGQAG